MHCQNCGKEQNTSSNTNTSGQREKSIIPDEIKGWSWAAFLWTWIWGIGNSTWIALLALIPYANFAMMIVLGLKGREWAWQNKHWESVEQFKKTQRNWVKWWFILMIIPAILGIISTIILVSINPSEQLNRAKDASQKNNAAEILNANERYFAEYGKYPWNNSQNLIDSVYTTDDISKELWLSSLLDSGEITQDLVDKIQPPLALLLIKEQGENGITHVCYQPASKTNKKEAIEQCNTKGTFTNTMSKYLCFEGKEYDCLP